MKLYFLGTGAADFDWSRYGEPGISGSSSTLINGNILIDCGTTVMSAIDRFGIDAKKITDVVITHNHSDHFDVKVFRKLTEITTVRLHASQEICASVKTICETCPIHYGDEFAVNGAVFTALPANHPVENPDEESFIYIVEIANKRLLYALDTANIVGRAYSLIGARDFDGIIWDTTCANDANLWMDFYHSNAVNFRKIRKAFSVLGKLKPDCKVIFSHRARQFWPSDPEAVAKIGMNEKAIIVYDGDTVYL